MVARAGKVALGMNRLADETSPYLLQHAGNPVDWYPWGEEALRPRAERGQADPALDRLRRLPLVPRDGARVVRGRSDGAADERAVRERQGRPRGAPRRRRGLHGGGRCAHRPGRLADDRLPHARRASRSSAARTTRPSRGTACRRSASCWSRSPRRTAERREDVAQNAAALVERRLRRARRLAVARAADGGARRRRGRRRSRRSRRAPGAASGARRSSRRRRRSSCCCARGRARAGDRATLDGMAAGGMYDLVGGGFHRYSVDEQWLVPHFEKMLYDNALLAPAYLHAWLVTGEERYGTSSSRRSSTCLRELRSTAAASPPRRTRTPTASRA